MSKESWSRTFKNIEDRFYKKVAVVPNGCWIWTASKNQYGYPIFSENRKACLATRWIYQRLRGPIEPGMDLDHACRNPACVNPGHLEPVSRRVNLLCGVGLTAQRFNQTRCKRGHEFTPENTYWYGKHKTQRMCKACVALRYQRRKRKEIHAAQSGKK